jgi:hypothetical protein
MITAEQILAMSSGLIDIYQSIEEDLLINVCKRFNADVENKSISNWQMDKLSQLGAVKKSNIAIIAKYTKRTEKEITDIITKAGYKTLDYDEQIYQQAFSKGILKYSPLPLNASPAIQQAIIAATNNTREYFNTINTTALESANQAFLDVVNTSYLKVSTGVSDLSSAVKTSVRDLADKGITGVTYMSKAGRVTHTNVDVAVRRGIVTSTSQSAGVLQETRAKDWGSNLVEVTSSASARPSHAAWQGKIYSLQGGTEQYPNLRAVTGYGTAGGLCGCNCSHTFYPFFEGISTQKYYPTDAKQNKIDYEESQQQRKIEREIRQQKRRAAAAEAAKDKDGVIAANAAIKAKQAEMRAFIKDTGRTRRSNREQI